MTRLRENNIVREEEFKMSPKEINQRKHRRTQKAEQKIRDEVRSPGSGKVAARMITPRGSRRRRAAVTAVEPRKDFIMQHEPPDDGSDGAA